MTETDMVNHPPHYRALPGVDFECIELARYLTFDVGNAVKYMWRTDRKNGREDIDKARWYIEDAIDHQDFVFNQGHSFARRQAAERMLITVANAQENRFRAVFFQALSTSNLNHALSALTVLLRGGE